MSHKAGFGLVQALVTVVLIGGAIAQRGRASTENLRIIEEAKRAFVLNNPGVALTSEDQLMPYFPSHEMPVGAHKGESYLNTTSLSAVATSSANADSTFEPWSLFFGPPDKNRISRGLLSRWNRLAASQQLKVLEPRLQRNQ